MLGNLFIISSPSGGGKGTLIREVLKTVPNVGYSVSLTTRQPRAGERNGREYFFVPRDEFEKRINDGEFLEYAEVHGNFYGTSQHQVREMIEQGTDIILEIDVQGADIVRGKISEAVAVFIMPPSLKILRERLSGRGTETAETLALRMKNAPAEIAHFEKFDYVIINDELMSAVGQLRSIFFAERARANRQKRVIERILADFPQ